MAIRKRAWTAPDGTAKQAWLVDYRDQAGKRRAKQFARKKDAEAWATETASQVRRGIHTADSVSINVSQAAERWIASVRASGREPTTIAAYDQHVRLHIVPRCGARKLSQLTAPEIKGILDEWLLHLSRPMALRLLRSLRAIIGEAQQDGLVAQNVALAVKPKKEPRRKADIAPPSKAELRAILEAAAKGTPKARALVELATFSGLRSSELRGLPWSAIDLKLGTVKVEQRADAKGVIGPPKSKAGFRSVPIPPRTVAALKAWKLACPAHPLDLAFPSKKGKPLSHHIMIKNLVGPVQIAAGVKVGEGDNSKPRYGMHAFRHAAASLWIEHKLSPKRVQTLMGHNSIQVTFDTYGHLFEQADQDAQDAAAIERALFADATPAQHGSRNT